jgi:hypothetical protein
VIKLAAPFPPLVKVHSLSLESYHLGIHYTSLMLRIALANLPSVAYKYHSGCRTNIPYCATRFGRIKMKPRRITWPPASPTSSKKPGVRSRMHSPLTVCWKASTPEFHLCVVPSPCGG